MATTSHPATPPPPPPPSSDPSAKPADSANGHPAGDPEVPLTSAQDDGTSKRPRDARLIHAILSNLGIHSYQERVPLQLLDFAYRYTSGILNDSLRLSAEGYAAPADRNPGRKYHPVDDTNHITMPALRGAIASRHGHTFVGPLPKDYMLEQAAERNRIQLPAVEAALGVQLPPERYCLTGVGWGLKDEWESDEEVAREDGAPATSRDAGPSRDEDDATDDAMDGLDEDEEGAGTMEDVFGEEDTTMTLA